MTRFLKNLAKRKGVPPGTITGDGAAPPASLRITCFEYDADQFEEKELHALGQGSFRAARGRVTWVNIEGVTGGVLEQISRQLGVHPLVLEDVLHTGQRPKVEDYGDYLFVILKMLYEDEDGDMLAEQVSLIFGADYVISFQETRGDVFDPIRDRIRNNRGQVRKSGADYLAYTLLDAVVDNYFVILEKLDDEIEDMDNALTGEDVDPDMVRGLHDMKRDVIFLRRQIWPLREVINGLQRNEGTRLIRKATRFYLRDVYDNTIQVIDTIEGFRDMVSGMHDVYLSMMSNRMNEIMKVLTMFASIFIPLTFIAGIYGMNFRHMPELDWKLGYFAVLGVMAVLGLSMLAYFKRKKWF